MKVPSVLILLSVCLSSCSPDLSMTSPKNPNIILIMADDLGYECLSSNGCQSYSTPNIDAMAKEGLRFTSCYSQPVCTPSRVQMMTGRYNFRNYKMFGYLELSEKTFAHYFKEAGYQTCIAGKWQLGHGIEGPYLVGFDEYCLWQIYNNVAHTDVRGSRYADPKLYVNGKIVDTEVSEYGPDICAQFIIDFMKKNEKKPFLAYYPMILTHDPFVPTPQSADWSEEPNRRDTGYFKDMVGYTDYLVGKIREAADNLNCDRETYIFFTGDNGTGRQIITDWNNTRVKGGKSLTIETGIHVPLIVYSPSNIETGNSSALIDFTDFLPTLCELANIPVDEKPKIDGMSFLDILNGKKHKVREFIYGYYWQRGRDPLNIKEYIRTNQYKYYRSGLVFDPVSDPEEKSPLSRMDIGAQYDSLINVLNLSMNSVRQN